MLESRTVTEDTGWRYSFEGLDLYDADDKQYAYSVEEAAVPAGYKATVSGFDITNTLDPEEPRVPGTPDAPDAPKKVPPGHAMPPTGDASLVPAAAALLGSGLALGWAARKRRR